MNLLSLDSSLQAIYPPIVTKQRQNARNKHEFCTYNIQLIERKISTFSGKEEHPQNKHHNFTYALRFLL